MSTVVVVYSEHSSYGTRRVTWTGTCLLMPLLIVMLLRAGPGLAIILFLRIQGNKVDRIRNA